MARIPKHNQGETDRQERPSGQHSFLKLLGATGVVLWGAVTGYEFIHSLNQSADIGDCVVDLKHSMPPGLHETPINEDDARSFTSCDKAFSDPQLDENFSNFPISVAALQEYRDEHVFALDNLDDYVLIPALFVVAGATADRIRRGLDGE